MGAATVELANKVSFERTDQMGQYYKVANLDKKQIIHPHRFDDGMKLREFGCSSLGTMTGLAILLAVGNGQGGGDLRSNHPIIGSWAGDRIAIVGDSAEDYKEISKWTDVSSQVLEAMESWRD